MTKDEMLTALNELAEKIEGQTAVLGADLPRDDEGFLVHDGSELVDALRTLDEVSSVLSRMIFRIGNQV